MPGLQKCLHWKLDRDAPVLAYKRSSSRQMLAKYTNEGIHLSSYILTRNSLWGRELNKSL